MNPIVVSFGGGTNSTALLIGMVDAGVRPDAILFADTGGEVPEVYQHIEKFSAWLVAKGFPEVTWVRKVTKDGNTQTLEQNCLDEEMLPSLAYGFKSCSQKFKIAPQDKWCNNWDVAKECWKNGGRVTKFIGYDAGPRDRNRAKIFDDEKYVYVYPLISWNWDRAKCVEVCERAGFKPYKSSCFFCPAMKKSEVLELKALHPELLQRALEMEDNAKPNLQTVKGLGRRWSWRAFIEGDEKQCKLWGDDGAEDTPCGCYDG